MRAALGAGADLINDVRALTTPGAPQALAAHPSAGVCLMHSRGDPTTMQTLAQYDDVVEDVAAFLSERFQAAQVAGIVAERIVLDPGYGFAKTMEHSVELLARQEALLTRLAQAGVERPLLAGLSRKGTVGRPTGGRPVEQSLAAALLAAQRGARCAGTERARCRRDGGCAEGMAGRGAGRPGDGGHRPGRQSGRCTRRPGLGQATVGSLP